MFRTYHHTQGGALSSPRSRFSPRPENMLDGSGVFASTTSPARPVTAPEMPPAMFASGGVPAAVKGCLYVTAPPGTAPPRDETTGLAIDTSPIATVKRPNVTAKKADAIRVPGGVAARRRLLNPCPAAAVPGGGGGDNDAGAVGALDDATAAAATTALPHTHKRANCHRQFFSGA